MNRWRGMSRTNALQEHGAEHAAGGVGSSSCAQMSRQRSARDGGRRHARRLEAAPASRRPGSRRSWLLLVQRDGHEGGRMTPSVGSPLTEQLGVAGGDGCQQHVVDLPRRVWATLLLHRGNRERWRACGPIRSCGSRWSAGLVRPRRAPAPPAMSSGCAGSWPGAAKRGELTVEFAEPPAQIVLQQLSRAGRTDRCPGRRAGLRWVGDGSKNAARVATPATPSAMA